MNERTSLQIRAAHFRRDLERAGDNPVIAAQAQVRLADIEEQLEAIRLQGADAPPDELPRAAYFLKGDGDPGQDGVRPVLAAETMALYERMFVEQALHDEHEAAGGNGRATNESLPGLRLTEVHRGSFGLEFSPLWLHDHARLELHAKSLRHVAAAVVAVVEGECRDEVIRNIPAGVLKPLECFLKTLAKHGAEVRFAFPDDSGETLSREKIQWAADRLDRVELVG